MVSRYYLHFLKKLFIKSFSCQDKTDCSIKNLGGIAWTIVTQKELCFHVTILGLSDIFPKSKVCVKTLLVFSNKL